MNENIIVLGIILSIIFYEITEMSPGGLIVPGYFALFLNEPKRIIITLIVSILALLIVRIISKYAIVFGRRKFVLFILITFLLKYIFNYFNLDFLLGGDAIGVLIPAILAQDIERNGANKTIPALIILSIVIRSVMIISEGLL